MPRTIALAVATATALLSSCSYLALHTAAEPARLDDTLARLPSAALPPLLPNTQYPIAQAFCGNTPDPAAIDSQRSFIWSACNGGGPTHTSPVQGISSTGYWPLYVNNDEFNINGTFTNRIDLTWFQTNHPDWILYQCDQKTLAWPNNLNPTERAKVPLNFTNPAVRAFINKFLTQYISAGFGGIAWDNINVSNPGKACGYKRSNIFHPLFSGVSRVSGFDPAFAAAATSFACRETNYIRSIGGYNIGNIFDVGFAADTAPLNLLALLWTQRIANCFDIVTQESPYISCKQSTTETLNCKFLTNAAFDYALVASQRIVHRQGWWLVEYPPCTTGPISAPSSCVSLGRQRYQAYATAMWLLLRSQPGEPKSYWSPIGFLNLSTESEHGKFTLLDSSWQPQVGIPRDRAYLGPGGCIERRYTFGHIALNRNPITACTFNAPNNSTDQFDTPIPPGPNTLQPLSATVAKENQQ